MVGKIEHVLIMYKIKQDIDLIISCFLAFKYDYYLT
jgi:hypothetical protein